MRLKNLILIIEAKTIELIFKIRLKLDNCLNEIKSPSILLKRITKVRFLKKISHRYSIFRWIKVLPRANDKILLITLSKQPVIIWAEQINNPQILLNKLQKMILNRNQMKNFNQSASRVLLRKLISSRQRSIKILRLRILLKQSRNISRSTKQETNK